MNISCGQARERLISTIGTIANSGIVSVRALQSNQELYESLRVDVRNWSADAAGQPDAVGQICSEVGLSAEELADRFVGWFFAQGPTGRYMRLDGILTLANAFDAEEAVEYLTKGLHNFAAELRRSHWRKEGKERVARAFVGEDGDDAERLLGALGMEAGEFIADVAYLAEVMNLSKEALTDLLSTGSQVSLVKGMTRDLSRCFGRDLTQTLAPLLAQAEAFVLPERFREDRTALLAFVCRQDSISTRERLVSRSHPDDR